MASNTNNATQAGAVIACPECDLLQREPRTPAGEVVSCARCGVTLFSTRSGTLDSSLAFTLAAAALYLVSNSLPIIGLDVQGKFTETTLFGAIQELYRQGKDGIAALVFVTAILAPALELAALCYLLVPLRLGYAPPHAALAFRIAPAARSWGLMDVFVLGVLVAIVKLGSIASVIHGVALWSFGGLILLMAGVESTFNPREIWSCLEAIGHPLPVQAELAADAPAGAARGVR